MERFFAKTTPERFLKRLQKSCEPWGSSAYEKGGAYMVSFRGRRFTLTKNGDRGRTRPQRVFRGHVAAYEPGRRQPGRQSGENVSGTVITGRFGMMARDRLLVYCPAQLMVLLAVFLTPTLEQKFAVILWLAVLICSFVLIGFMTTMDRLTGMERQKEMTDFLKQMGEKPR